MKRLLVITLILLGAGCQKQQATPFVPPPMNVEVTPVIQQDVPIYSEWIVTLDGYVNANIKPQVSGYLVSQLYQEGSLVHKGDVLFQIDERPFKALLEKAQGQLAQARAELGKATMDVIRDTPLAKDKAIAQSQLDDESQAKLGAKARVLSARADVDQAQLNLEFTKVRSLIDGIAGIAQVQMGNLVDPNTLLTTVSQLDPIKAYVSMTEAEYFRYIHAPEDQDLAPVLVLSNQETYHSRGHFIFADRQINPGTGTILVAVLFPNPGNVLRPGQFGRIRVAMNIKKNSILVPQRAVIEIQGSDQVAVVGHDNKVSIKQVKASEKVGTMWVIDEGLMPHDRVVTEGLQNVKDGAVVNTTVINWPKEK
ncbi:MAG: efflux RND transporter periplasmic adaptor subunit [Candidatus Omnitrophica bacterium]|nr:efflux RND transporter periplasmic adaptor subunit [Candidatus Omnitrophota bacterium]